MAKKSKTNNALIISIVASSLLISASLVFLGYQVSKNANPKQKESPLEKYIDEVSADIDHDDAFLGDADAPVTLAEYSDYQCPFCRLHFLNAYSQIKSEYVDTGKVKLVFKDFPLDFHEDALPAANAAECLRAESDDETYFAYHDAIFEMQGPFENGTVSIPESTLFDLAADLGVDSSSFKKCARSEKFYPEIAADVLAGLSSGVEGTPGFTVNGTLVEGALDFEEFAEVIETELAKAGG